MSHEGIEGLQDRSSRPHSSPRRTPADVEERVLALRRKLRQGQDRIGPVAGVPARTVGAILARNQVPRLAECDPLTGMVIRASKQTAVRYERSAPGELVHMDVKKLGRIHDGGGWRANGREHGQTSAQKRARIGFDYVHSLVDDHSRLAYSEILPDEKGPTCGAFLLRAADYFAGRGITHIERVMTDNHFSNRLSGDVRAAITALDAKHVLIRPHCTCQVFRSNDERAAALAPWLEHYNTQRHHSAIGGPPISRLSPT